LAAGDRSDPAALIERFDRLPEALLRVMAAEHAAELLPVLRDYASALPRRVGRFPFDYADFVARRMRATFHAARSPALKAVALQATLEAAVALNRFAAMDAFNRLLTSVSTVDVALAIAEMLRAHAPAYSEVARGASPDRLHPVIREVQQELASTADQLY
jgi:hypothetical protein